MQLMIVDIHTGMLITRVLGYVDVLMSTRVFEGY